MHVFRLYKCVCNVCALFNCDYLKLKVFLQKINELTTVQKKDIYITIFPRQPIISPIAKYCWSNMGTSDVLQA